MFKNIKNHVRIMVQNPDEPAYEFSASLEKICEEDAKQYGELLIVSPTVTHMTTSSNGRLTATIQFQTENLPKILEQQNRVELLGDAELEAMRFLHKPTNKVYRLNGAGGLIRVDGSTNVSIPLWLSENSTDWHQMSKSEINQ